MQSKTSSTASSQGMFPRGGGQKSIYNTCYKETAKGFHWALRNSSAARSKPDVTTIQVFSSTWLWGQDRESCLALYRPPCPIGRHHLPCHHALLSDPSQVTAELCNSGCPPVKWVTQWHCSCLKTPCAWLLKGEGESKASAAHHVAGFCSSGQAASLPWCMARAARYPPW